MKSKTIIGLIALLIFCALATGTVFAAGGITYPEVGLANPSGGIRTIIENFLTWILGIVGIIALIAFVISGIQYLTAAGSDTQMEAGKRNLTYSIIGVVVASAGMVIVKAIDAFLRGN